MIYLDNAATTYKKPDAVIEAVCHAMTSFGNPDRGAHEASLNALRTIYETRRNLAKLFGVKKAQQIAFSSNATESLNIAVHGLLGRRDHVITTELEHNSVLRPLYRLQKEGLQMDVLKSDSLGNADINALDDLFRENTKAVICTHASNLTGNMVNIEKIGKICKAHQCLFIVDAAQTAGVFPIDVEKMNIDVLCFTGHKGLMGPQGNGGIYVREGLRIDPLKTGGSGFKTFAQEHPEKMPAALEAGTLNGHGIAGLNAALHYIEEIGMEAIREKESKLMTLFYEGIRRLPGIKIYGDFRTEMRAPIVAFNLRDYDSAKISDLLYQRHGICTRPGGHCAPLMHRAFHTEEQGAVRVSFSYHNTEEEAATAAEAVAAIK